MPGLCLSYHSHSPQWMGWFAQTCLQSAQTGSMYSSLPLAFWTSVCNIIEWLGFSSVVEGLFGDEGGERGWRDEGKSNCQFPHSCTIRDWPLSGKGWRSLDGEVRSNISTDLVPTPKDLVQRTSHKVIPNPQSNRRDGHQYHSISQKRKVKCWIDHTFTQSHTVGSSGVGLPCLSEVCWFTLALWKLQPSWKT